MRSFKICLKINQKQEKKLREDDVCVEIMKFNKSKS